MDWNSAEPDRIGLRMHMFTGAAKVNAGWADTAGSPILGVLDYSLRISERYSVRWSRQHLVHLEICPRAYCDYGPMNAALK